MFRAALLSISFALIAYPQAASFRWVQAIGGSGNSAIAGMGVDAEGNTYVAGNTTSLDLPVRFAMQSKPGGSGLYRIDGTGSAWRNLLSAGLANVNALAAAPSDPRVVYAISGRTLERTNDGGDTWTTLAQFDTYVNGLAIDPRHSAIVYAATSEQGVLKSTDAGATWTPINNGIPPYSDGRPYAARVWIDPNNADVIFTATGRDFARSSNGGASWQVQTVYIDALRILDITFDPFTPGVIYAATYAAPRKSTDDGLTWTSLTGLPDGYPVLRTVIPDFQHAGRLIGLSNYGDLWIRTDSGTTWTLKRQYPFAGFGSITPDPANRVWYAISGGHVVVTSDTFDTLTPIGPPAVSNPIALTVAGGHIFLASTGGADIFVAKFDPQSNLVWSTYFGGASTDLAVAMTVDNAGNVYVTGLTSSLDFPVSANAYAKTGTSFVFKLNSDGTLAYSTCFTGAQPNAIAVDSAGSAYLAGVSYGLLPTTPGAYQPNFIFYSVPFGGTQPNGFLTKFDTSGSSLIFSTYTGQTPTSIVNAVAVNSAGEALIGGLSGLIKMGAAGNTVLTAKTIKGQIRAITVDSNDTFWIAGDTTADMGTPGAFQRSVARIPTLPGEQGNYGDSDGFVARLDLDLNISASTLIGGEASDSVLGLAIAPNGDIIVGGSTYSKAFPVRSAAQGSFSNATGFVAQFTPDLAALRWATFTGDTRVFNVRYVRPLPDATVVFAGSTEQLPGSSYGGLFPLDGIQGYLVNAALVPAAPRVDSVVNAASQLAVALSPGVTFQVRGAGFGPDSALTLNGLAVALISRTATTLTAEVPPDFNAKDAVTLAVTTSGGASQLKTAFLPAAPGIFSANGTGVGQGYILNQDGTLNSPSNPAKEGAPITIFATGVGTMTFDQGYAVTDTTVNVWVDGFSAAGIAAVLGPVDGLPGDVYQISVFVPHPADFAASNPYLKDFKMPPAVAVNIGVRGIKSQGGISLSVAQ